MKFIIALIIVCSALMPMPKNMIKGDKIVKKSNCGIHFLNSNNYPEHIHEVLRHYEKLMTH